jgi:hypothetical protein
MYELFNEPAIQLELHHALCGCGFHGEAITRGNTKNLTEEQRKAEREEAYRRRHPEAVVPSIFERRVINNPPGPRPPRPPRPPNENNTGGRRRRKRKGRKKKQQEEQQEEHQEENNDENDNYDDNENNNEDEEHEQEDEPVGRNQPKEKINYTDEQKVFILLNDLYDRYNITRNELFRMYHDAEDEKELEEQVLLNFNLRAGNNRKLSVNDNMEKNLMLSLLHNLDLSVVEDGEENYVFFTTDMLFEMYDRTTGTPAEKAEKVASDAIKITLALEKSLSTQEFWKAMFPYVIDVPTNEIIRWIDQISRKLKSFDDNQWHGNPENGEEEQTRIAFSKLIKMLENYDNGKTFEAFKTIYSEWIKIGENLLRNYEYADQHIMEYLEKIKQDTNPDYVNEDDTINQRQRKHLIHDMIVYDREQQEIKTNTAYEQAKHKFAEEYLNFRNRIANTLVQIKKTQTGQREWDRQKGAHFDNNVKNYNHGQQRYFHLRDPQRQTKLDLRLESTLCPKCREEEKYAGIESRSKKKRDSANRKRVVIGYPYCLQHTRQLFHVEYRKVTERDNPAELNKNAPLNYNQGDGPLVYKLYARGKTSKSNRTLFRYNDWICPYGGHIIDQQTETKDYHNSYAPYTLRINNNDYDEAADRRGIGSLARVVQHNANEANCVAEYNDVKKEMWLRATKEIKGKQEIIRSETNDTTVGTKPSLMRMGAPERWETNRNVDKMFEDTATRNTKFRPPKYPNKRFQGPNEQRTRLDWNVSIFPNAYGQDTNKGKKRTRYELEHNRGNAPKTAQLIRGEYYHDD